MYYKLKVIKQVKEGNQGDSKPVTKNISRAAIEI